MIPNPSDVKNSGGVFTDRGVSMVDYGMLNVSIAGNWENKNIHKKE